MSGFVRRGEHVCLLRGQVVWCPPARLVPTDSRDPLRRHPRIPRGSAWGRDPVQEHVRARPPGRLRIHHLIRQPRPDVRLTPVRGTADLVHGLPRRPIEHLNSACKHQPRKHHRVDGIARSHHRGRSSRPAPRLPGRPGGPRPPTARPRQSAKNRRQPAFWPTGFCPEFCPPSEPFPWPFPSAPKTFVSAATTYDGARH